MLVKLWLLITAALSLSTSTISVTGFLITGFTDVDSVALCHLFENFKLPSTSGSDDISISSKIQKCTVPLYLPHFLETSTLPDNWKVVNVVPLQKAGNAHIPPNYRPMFLTRIACKLFKHIH